MRLQFRPLKFTQLIIRLTTTGNAKACGGSKKNENEIIVSYDYRQMIYLHNLAPTAPHKQISGSNTSETYLTRFTECFYINCNVSYSYKTTILNYTIFRYSSVQFTSGPVNRDSLIKIKIVTDTDKPIIFI